MKKVTKGVRVFVSKQELQKSCIKSEVDEFGNTEQTVFYVDGQSVSISPRCSVPISACKPL